MQFFFRNSDALIADTADNCICVCVVCAIAIEEPVGEYLMALERYIFKNHVKHSRICSNPGVFGMNNSDRNIFCAC